MTQRDAVTTTDNGILVSENRVQKDWIDINGHMNVAYYVLAFDYGVDALWEHVGISDDYIRERKLSTFAVDADVSYRAELKLDDPYRVVTQILAIDAKRLHQFQRMYHAEQGFLAATCEWMNLHVNLESRRVSPFPDEILRNFVGVAESQPQQEIPDNACARLRVKQPLFAVQGYPTGELAT